MPKVQGSSGPYSITLSIFDIPIPVLSNILGMSPPSLLPSFVQYFKSTTFFRQNPSWTESDHGLSF